MFIVADDCISIVRLIKWKLEAAFGKEMGVIMAADGKEAVAAFENLLKEGRHSDIDAVLMDYHMPKMCGLDAINLIRALESEHVVEQPVSIIGFSADVSDEMNDMFMQGGANFLIEKPPEPGVLEEMCRDIIDKRKSSVTGASAKAKSSLAFGGKANTEATFNEPDK